MSKRWVQYYSVKLYIYIAVDGHISAMFCVLIFYLIFGNNQN